MKMVIVEIRGNSAVALRDDGRFIRTRQRGYQIGQTIEHSGISGTFRPLTRIAAAAVAAVILLGTTTALAIRMPYSYVTLDVNPSIRYTLNIFDRVLDVDAINEDAAAVVDALEHSDVVHQRIEDAIELTVDQCRKDGYLYETEDDYVVLSVASKADAKASRLTDQLQRDSFGGGFISAEVVPATIQEMRDAQQKGTTPGKLAVIRRMQEKTGDTSQTEEWIRTPVREIIQAMAGSGKNMKEANSPAQNADLNEGSKGSGGQGQSQSSQNSQKHSQSPQNQIPQSQGQQSEDQQSEDQQSEGQQSEGQQNQSKQDQSSQGQSKQSPGRESQQSQSQSQSQQSQSPQSQNTQSQSQQNQDQGNQNQSKLTQVQKDDEQAQTQANTPETAGIPPETAASQATQKKSENPAQAADSEVEEQTSGKDGDGASDRGSEEEQPTPPKKKEAPSTEKMTESRDKGNSQNAGKGVPAQD